MILNSAVLLRIPSSYRITPSKKTPPPKIINPLSALCSLKLPLFPILHYTNRIQHPIQPIQNQLQPILPPILPKQRLRHIQHPLQPLQLQQRLQPIPRHNRRLTTIRIQQNHQRMIITPTLRLPRERPLVKQPERIQLERMLRRQRMHHNLQDQLRIPPLQNTHLPLQPRNLTRPQTPRRVRHHRIHPWHRP
jgi:hypothetical protein